MHVTIENDRILPYTARRIAAYLVDVTVLMILVQAAQWGLLALTGGFPYRQLDQMNNGWLIYGWVLLTVSLPIWLYFIIGERSSWQGTPGKRLLGLRVVSEGDAPVQLGQAVTRTLLKLVPWEIYHLAFMLPVPLFNDPNPAFRPGFLVGAMVMALYLLVLLRTPWRQSIHDLVARTAVIRV